MRGLDEELEFYDLLSIDAAGDVDFDLRPRHEERASVCILSFFTHAALQGHH
jgi:hypothetical protein